jgi:hypothetical protein
VACYRATLPLPLPLPLPDEQTSVRVPAAVHTLAGRWLYAVLALPHMKFSTGREGSQEGYCGKVGVELAEQRC